ncbi:MAG: MBL fold metallo-hydrolase [Bacteroidia bacterium]|nr:MBL fold metallo-hydrolase [Bacteroidia bacterium]
MKLYTIDTGYFKLDGGAMFGVVPKTIWNKLNPSDSNNLCTWAMRCLLVEAGNRLILIDNGLGDKQDQKFFAHYEPTEFNSLNASLKKSGFNASDITDVFLTHLHFDHCGGSVRWNAARDGYELSFPNATYWSNERHWIWATKPNARERASFLRENILPIQESGHLKFIREDEEFIPGISVLFVNGHTDAMMLPMIEYKGKTLVYCADLLPSAHHIPLPYVMAYDTRPLITLEEKKVFLENAVARGYLLFFEHDPVNVCGTVEKTERGYKCGSTFLPEEI